MRLTIALPSAVLVAIILWVNLRPAAPPTEKPRVHPVAREPAGQAVAVPVPVTVPAPGLAEVDYTPGPLEKYILDNLEPLGLNNKPARGCMIFDSQFSESAHLTSYLASLTEYNKLLAAFKPVPPVVPRLASDPNVCESLELVQDGLNTLFKGELTLTKRGYVDPLLPIMRHPGICNGKADLMTLTYLVHDFAFMCRQLKPTSRIVLFDMGASLVFHGDVTNSPPIYLLELYRKFGFHFDHIYAFEITKQDPAHVYSVVPESLLGAYHWINVGVSADPANRLNPLNWILNNFNEDDLIIVKLDVDTPSVEVPLAQMLRDTPRLHELVDQFYFEHHIFLQELMGPWGSAIAGSIGESMTLFAEMRKKGVASHSWV